MPASSLGWAIGAAEAGDGELSLKRWRAGVTSDVTIQLRIMGAYSATAPYNCPKSALILSNACNVIANLYYLGSIRRHSRWTRSWAWRCWPPATRLISPRCRPMPGRLRPPTGSLEPERVRHLGLGLQERVSLRVLPAHRRRQCAGRDQGFTVALAKAQSLYGTFGHGGARAARRRQSTTARSPGMARSTRRGWSPTWRS